MSTLNQGVRSIDYIANMVIAEAEDVTDRNYQRYLQLAINCYLYELKLSTSPTIKTVHLQMDDNRTIPFPEDYINYTAIGVCLNGSIWTLSLNNAMCLNRAEDCPVELAQAAQLSQDSTPEQISFIVPFNYYFTGAVRGGQYVGEQYSYGGGWNKKGYFRIDNEMRRIEFSSSVPTTDIILEYNSTGINCDGTMMIPFEAVAAVKAYVHWQRIEHNQKISSSEKERKRREYITQFNILKHYKLSFTVSEYLDAKYKTIKSTFKR